MRSWSLAAFRLSLSVCLILAAFAGTALAADWLPLRPDAAGAAAQVSLESATHETTTAIVEVPGLQAEIRDSAEGGFTALSFDGGDVAGELGRPELPVLRRLIEIPPGAEVRVRLEVLGGPEVRSLAGWGLPARVWPVQPPRVKTEDAGPGPEFAYDRDHYATSAFLPADPVQVVDRVRIRDRELALVEIRPLAYNPAQGTLSIWTRGRLIVEARGGNACALGRPDTRGGRAMVAGLALNPPLVAPPVCDSRAPLGPDAASGAEGLLVIVHDAFYDAVAPFLDWKERTGWKVVARKTSEIADGTPTDVEVKQVIQQAYDTWSSPRLGYLLLVGDTDFTPIHQGNGGGNSQVTDNWYACVSGSDFLADMAVARVSVRTAQQAADVVDKILTYERATFPSSSWIKKSGFVGTADSGYIDMIEATHDWCIDTFYRPNGYTATAWSHGYPACDRHYNTYDADTSDIAGSINEGRAFVNYSGHGGNTSWQGPTGHGSYDTDDVRANTNDGMYPFVIANACVTGSLQDTECFAETWQRAAHKGAIAYLGASNNSYWDEDDYFQRRLNTHLFPMDSTPPIAVVNNRAKADLYSHYGNTGTVAYYIDMYNLLCEPSLTMWTRAPRLLDVSYDAQIPAGSSSMTVTVKRADSAVQGDLVAARKKDEGILAAAYSDASGVAVLHFDPAPMNPGPMEITVTGHDDRPFEGTTDVIPMDGPWLRLRSHAVTDLGSGCDADGVPDIGETVEFAITIENIGSGAAPGAWVTLSAAADVAVLDSPLAAGSVPPGGAAQVTFRVRIGAGVSCQATPLFTVGMGCPDCTTRQDGFTELLESDHRIEAHDEAMEHAGAEAPGWSHQALFGTDEWRVVATQNHTPGGQYSYFASDRALQRDVVLVTDPLAPQGNATLSFWQRYELTVAKSGAMVEISENGGASWTDLHGFFGEHPYTHECGNGVDARKCWSGSSGGWVRTTVELSSFAGKTVRVRFRLGSINGTGTGWWVDDVSLVNDFVGCDVHPCGIPGEIAITAVDRAAGGTVLRFQDDVVAQRYRVWRATDCRAAESFVDVTALDDDDTDTTFRDLFEGPYACWIVEGVGPDGAGPWGHFGR